MRRSGKLIRITVFLLLAFIMLAATFNVLWLKDDDNARITMDTFYKLPKNSVDVMLVGPSSIREHYIPPLAYSECGVVSYSLSTGAQNFDAAKYLISEAELTQDPMLYVVDVRALAGISSMYYSEAAIRKVADSMHIYSPNRFEYINRMYDRWDSTWGYDSSRLDLLYGAGVYHYRWEDIDPEDFGIEYDSWMGYSLEERVCVFDNEDRLENMTDERGPLKSYAEEVLKDFLDYCDANDLNVLFVNMPGDYEKEYNLALNTIEDEVKDRGYELLDLNRYVDEIGLDTGTDMRDHIHVNTRGAVKVTKYLDEYLKGNYGIPDRRNEGKDIYSVWQDKYASFIAEKDKRFIIDDRIEGG